MRSFQNCCMPLPWLLLWLLFPVCPLPESLPGGRFGFLNGDGECVSLAF